MTTIYETLIRVHDCGRYAVHAKVDRQVEHLRPSGTPRMWTLSLVAVDPVEQKDWYGVIATTSAAVQQAVAGGRWVSHCAHADGDSITAIAHVTPKVKGCRTASAARLTRFRADDAAVQDYVHQRLAVCIGGIMVSVLAREEVFVDKPRAEFRQPGAWVQVRGTVTDSARVGHAILHGIGGAKAFGVGRLVTERSALYPIAHRIRQAWEDTITHP